MFLQMVVGVLATRVGCSLEKLKIEKAMYRLKNKKLKRKAIYNWKSKN